MKYLSVIFFVFFLAACGEDTAPPTTPENLEATAVSASAIQVSWDPASDNVGVTGYELSRDGRLRADLANTTFTDTGLTNSTTYCYTVLAFDEEGNKSDSTDPACATTLAVADTIAPTTPTNVRAAAVDSSAIQVTWTASTDNIAVRGYSIYNALTLRSDLIANTTGTSFLHNGLTADTLHCYTVSAFDASGNESDTSSPAQCDRTDPEPSP